MKYNIEFARLLAVMLVTFTHLRHEFVDGWEHVVLDLVPQVGTLVLSNISGYLFIKVSYRKGNLFTKKVKSLLIPYLIANLVVLIPVLALHYMGYDYLNRLGYDLKLFTEGLLSLNSPPVNPPTYFIRDIFIVFMLISTVIYRDWRGLIFIIPLLIFGKLMLRYDISALFIGGCIYAYAEKKINHRILLLFIISIVIGLIIYSIPFQILKYGIGIVLFLSIINLKIDFIKTGGYTYLLHLYHSPIIVFSYPILLLITGNSYALIGLQLIVAFTISYLIFKISKRYNFNILAGGRL